MDSRTHSSLLVRIATAIAIAAFAWWGLTQWTGREEQPGEAADDEGIQAFSQEWQAMFDREERIASITPVLEDLTFAVKNLALPDGRTRSHFDDVVSVSDWADDPWVMSSEISHLGIVSHRARQAATRTVPRDRVVLWKSFLANVAYFHQASFSAVSGELAAAESGNPEVFELEVLFAGVAAMQNGDVASLNTKQRLVLRNVQSDSDPRWVISAWQSLEGERSLTSGFLFEEV